MNINETLYKTYVNARNDDLNNTAIYTFNGDVITHKRLLNEIDLAAEGLSCIRDCDDFRIGVLSTSHYEEAVFLLAASKIGAVCKFIDFTKNIADIRESIVESSVRVLIIGEEFLEMEPFINPLNLPVIILGGALSEKPNHRTFQDLIKASGSCTLQPVEYKENSCAVIINSSGTTGPAKPIELSDRAINAAVEKMVATDYPMTKGNLLLKMIPSHIGLGLITTLYTGLVIGIPVYYLIIAHPSVSIEFFVKFINGFDKFLDEHRLPSDTRLLLFGSPMYYRGLLSLSDHVQDLSFIGCMLAAGSAMSKEELELMDSTFATKGCKVPVVNGYGQNEMAGAVSLNRNSMNRRGSAGIVVDGTQLKIVDISDGSAKGKNAPGKVLERSESLFLGYENMPERTASSFVKDSNGQMWFDTNDIGYIDDDGFLFITGRTSRLIIRFDQKVSLDKMESKIRMSKYVKDVGVISLHHKPYDLTNAFVTLNDEYSTENVSPEMIIESIQSSPNALTELESLDKLYIMDSLPYLLSGKIDYHALGKNIDQQ